MEVLKWLVRIGHGLWLTGLRWCLYATQSASKLNRALSIGIFYSKVVKRPDNTLQAGRNPPGCSFKQLREVNPTYDLGGWMGRK